MANQPADQSAIMAMRYLEPTQASGRALVTRRIPGDVVMLSLLRFRDIADYSTSPELEPTHAISGADAFQRYIQHTLPFLRESGGELLFLGSGGPFLIGPEVERWDLAMLLRQRSVELFLAFASNVGLGWTWAPDRGPGRFSFAAPGIHCLSLVDVTARRTVQRPPRTEREQIAHELRKRVPDHRIRDHPVTR